MQQLLERSFRAGPLGRQSRAHSNGSRRRDWPRGIDPGDTAGVNRTTVGVAYRSRARSRSRREASRVFRAGRFPFTISFYEFHAAARRSIDRAIGGKGRASEEGSLAHEVPASAWSSAEIATGGNVRGRAFSRARVNSRNDRRCARSRHSDK